MKLETENSCSVARGKLAAGNPRSGIALIITLTIMALLLILAVAFMTNMRSERQVSLYYRRQVEARQAALAGLHTAIAKMSRFYTDAEAVNGSVATMAGRFYYTNGTGSATVAVPGGTPRPSGFVPATNNMLMFSWIKGEVLGGGTTNWADKVNLNGGNFKWPREANQSGIYLPIANPCVNPLLATGEGWGPDKPAIWASYLRTYGSDDARFAFWIDDESSKINISNAYSKDLKDVGIENILAFSSVGYFAVPYSTTNPPPYATIVQPVGLTRKNISSVDLRMLDVGEVSPSYDNYTPDGPKRWSEAAVLSSIEAARNPGTWRPFQTPDEVLSLQNTLTMNDYQAVKSCLTAWSVENEDRAQLFRKTDSKNNNSPIMRTNVSETIPVDATQVPAYAQLAAKTLYDFLMVDCKVDVSTSAGKWFNSATLSNKFSDVYQPLTNGSVQQIVANIVSYVSNPARVIPLGSTPPTVFPDVSHSWNPETQTNRPTGACGLWKAAYMNEIAVSLCWQPIQPPAPALKRWQLWASLYVELINPYEVSLPNSVPWQQYQLFLDGNVAITCALKAPALPSTLSQAWTTNNIAITSATQIPANSYSSPDSPGTPLNCFQWKVGSEIITNTQPIITTMTLSLPQIRQTMECGDQHLKGIIDWSMATNLPIAVQQPAQSAAVSSLAGNPPPTAAEFWSTANHAQWAISKNDPRVRVWYGPYTYDKVTVRGYKNPTGQNVSVDFSGGDVETAGSFAPNANKPEYRSNFVIAERGMKSIGELGFIHTGRPWRSLSLQYYGAQIDEIGAMGSSLAAIPDWALLDLFSVNSPPIYGRININNGGWHLGNNRENAYAPTIANCPTFEDPPYYPRVPNLMATWNYGLANFLTVNNYQWAYTSLRSSAYSRHYVNHVTNPMFDSASVPLAAALNVIPSYRLRNKLANYIGYRYHPLTQARTSFAPQGDPSDTTFIPTRDIWQPYYTVGQICEVPHINYLFTGDGTQIGTTDADKEDTVRRIINVLTTRGDAFTVHAVGYADGGEARLMAVVERVRDPATTTQVIDRNKFRIKQVRWLNE